VLRNEDDKTVTKADIEAMSTWVEAKTSTQEIAYRPARVLMQDFTGVPAVVDLAAMRDGIKALGGDPQKINPLSPVDLVIDHSVMVDEFGNPRAFQANVTASMSATASAMSSSNGVRSAFDNFRVVPPGTGICHQVNLEYLAQTVWTKDQTVRWWPIPTRWWAPTATPPWSMVLAVLGWGVGGIEAEAAMLGQPISMLIPEVVGFKLTGKLREGTTATDLVLTVVEMLRAKGVVGKFVEFYGPGLDTICRWPTVRPLPTWRRNTARPAASSRSTMKRCATCATRAGDEEVASHWSRNTPRERFLARGGLRAGLHRTLSLDMGTIVPAISGPKRPQDYVAADRCQIRLSRKWLATFKRPMGEEMAVPVRITRWNRARS
jgi:aconitate hydratase